MFWIVTMLSIVLRLEKRLCPIRFRASCKNRDNATPLRRGAHVCRYTSGDDEVKDATRLPRGGLRFTENLLITSLNRETPRGKRVASQKSVHGSF
jgi:hypothetical protein